MTSSVAACQWLPDDENRVRPAPAVNRPDRTSGRDPNWSTAHPAARLAAMPAAPHMAVTSASKAQLMFSSFCRGTVKSIPLPVSPPLIIPSREQMARIRQQWEGRPDPVGSAASRGFPLLFIGGLAAGCGRGIRGPASAGRFFPMDRSGPLTVLRVGLAGSALPGRFKGRLGYPFCRRPRIPGGPHLSGLVVDPGCPAGAAEREPHDVQRAHKPRPERLAACAAGF